MYMYHGACTTMYIHSSHNFLLSYTCSHNNTLKMSETPNFMSGPSGVTLAILIESGYMPVLRDWFIITLRGSLISCLIAFISLFDISFTPELFLIFLNLIIIDNISFSAVKLKLKFKLVLGNLLILMNQLSTILLDKSGPTSLKNLIK